MNKEQTIATIDQILNEEVGFENNADVVALIKARERIFSYIESIMPKWVPVEEKLPESDTDYLVNCQYDHGGNYLAIAMPIKTKNGGVIWINDNSKAEYPTHWMPLPSGPIETK